MAKARQLSAHGFLPPAQIRDASGKDSRVGVKVAQCHRCRSSHWSEDYCWRYLSEFGAGAADSEDLRVLNLSPIPRVASRESRIPIPDPESLIPTVPLPAAAISSGSRPRTGRPCHR